MKKLTSSNLFSLLEWCCHNSSIVDENMQWQLALIELGSKRGNRLEVGQIQCLNFDLKKHNEENSEQRTTSIRASTLLLPLVFLMSSSTDFVPSTFRTARIT